MTREELILCLDKADYVKFPYHSISTGANHLLLLDLFFKYVEQMKIDLHRIQRILNKEILIPLTADQWTATVEMEKSLRARLDGTTPKKPSIYTPVSNGLSEHKGVLYITGFCREDIITHPGKVKPPVVHKTALTAAKAELPKILELGCSFWRYFPVEPAKLSYVRTEKVHYLDTVHLKW